MRLENRRGLEISIAAFFFCISFLSASIGQDDNSALTGENYSLYLTGENDSLNLTGENDSLNLAGESGSLNLTGEKKGIKISDSLILYSGDIIKLETNDYTYLKRISKKWASPPFTNRAESCVVSDNYDPTYSEFIVEDVGNNNQILLRANDTKHYLHLVNYKDAGNIKGWSLFNGYKFTSPFIKIDTTRPLKSCLFKVEVINNSYGDNMIALKASNGNYLQVYSTHEELWGKNINIIVAKKDLRPKDEYEPSVFTITRTGISPDYVKSISNVTFDFSSLTLSYKPSTIIQFEPQENTGNSERHISIMDKYLTRKTNKWTFERDIELAKGTKISANLGRKQGFAPKISYGGVSAEGPSSEISADFGYEVSTTITRSTKNTNEYEEEETHEVTWTQDIPIPPHTRVSAKLIANETTAEIPFTAMVQIKDRNTSNDYSYQINGTYYGTRCLAVKVKITEETLNQTSAITPNVSKSYDRPLFITSNPYRP